MIINHNYCIKLVPLDSFIYDARSHIHHHSKGNKTVPEKEATTRTEDGHK